MKIRFLMFLALLFTSVAIVAETPTSGPLAAALKPLVDEGKIAGAVMLVADKDKVLALESAGYASLATKEPMKNDAVFWIASMTKSVTGVAVMMLVDEGKISLDDPVEKYLPEFKGQQVQEREGGPLHPPKHPITIREVMTHTSGLLTARDPRLKYVPTLEEKVKQSAQFPLIREPGTKFEYNNVGINAAGRIVEVVSGMPYPEFLQQRLFTPLGMKDTTFWPTEEQASRLASSVRLNKDKTALEDVKLDANLPAETFAKLSKTATVPRRVFDNFGVGKFSEYANKYGEPAGGLFSTATDMGRFCQMLLNGGTFDGKRYLTENAVKAMSSVQSGDVKVTPDTGYGIGWYAKFAGAEPPGMGSYTHQGARKTVMWVDPKNGLAMVVMVQNFDMDPDAHKRMHQSFLKAATGVIGKNK
ncbi:CubicO group peptidase (beta-lactamase class C family) [Roseimicrobium gellanilyticum]|uniref:CubicO group peptidase (Beta-lactamase class C family) n=1 Tax=Roseimicrobium gellanilyticum TaxID=748857 RepID=A0A366HLS5_9BACT|nr:serine hydrolase domain-containing protein [Roseimicrobium gellanilyticum]RBP43824.1 CubicO group peptidase (beta-lactamase class C family) [Roseimicrobium gellanilyticum]